MRFQISDQNQNNTITISSIDSSTGYKQSCHFCNKSIAIAQLELSGNYNSGKNICKYYLRILEKACRAIIRAAKED